MTQITMNGKYTTRDGRPVRILCVDGPQPWPVVGIVEGDDFVMRWLADGGAPPSTGQNNPLDLVPVPRYVVVKTYSSPALRWAVRDSPIEAPYLARAATRELAQRIANSPSASPTCSTLTRRTRDGAYTYFYWWRAGRHRRG